MLYTVIYKYCPPYKFVNLIWKQFLQFLKVNKLIQYPVKLLQIMISHLMKIII